MEEIEEVDFSLGEVGGIEADFGFDMDFSFDFQTDEQLESRILKPKINAVTENQIKFDNAKKLAKKTE